MINSDGEFIEEITAEHARATCQAIHYNQDEIDKADIMTGVHRRMRLGQSSYGIYGRHSELPQSTLSWLVSLGYHVTWYSFRDGHYRYTYTIQWAVPPESAAIAPGITHTN